MKHKKILLLIFIISLILVYTVFLSINLLNQNSNLLSHNQVTSYYPKVMGSSSIDISNSQIANSTSDQQPVNQLTLRTYSGQANQPASPIASQGGQINNVPILMYHYIRDINDPNDKIGTNLSVSPTIFDSQLKWLKENGYQTVGFDYLLNPYDLRLITYDLQFKPIILTFDDGYIDAYTKAFPILKKYNFTAIFYITTSFVEKDNYLTWQQINELSNNSMNIGSHTQDHPDLSKTTLAKTENEISQSKNIIEEKINKKIYDFCYPSGKYNNDIINLLIKYGYKTATTTKSGIYDSNINSLFEIPRLRITNQTDLGKILQ